MKQRPNIFEYLDLKSYLGDVYNYRKTKEVSFSYQRWADEMGIRSRAYLRAIVIGEKAAELPSDQRKFYSTFVALRTEEFKQAQDLISDFNQRLLKLFNSTNPDGKKIYRINFQALPVSGEITSSPSSALEQSK